MKEKRQRPTPQQRALSRYTNYKVQAPETLMNFLAAKMPDASRTKLKTLLQKRVVLVNSEIVTAYDHPLKTGDRVQISKNKNTKAFHHKLLRIVYEDAYLIVVDKAAGLLSVNTPHEKERTAYHIMNDYVSRTVRRARVHIVHRLDRDTSGLLIFAKDEKTQRSFRDRWDSMVLTRQYTAVVEGVPQKKSGSITTWLTDRTYFVESSPYDNGGAKAVTHYRVLRHNQDYSLVEVHIETGRRNQIRVHMNEMGHPVVGDGRYGAPGRANPLKRLALHASRLAFIHPVTLQKMEFSSPAPESFVALTRGGVQPASSSR